jgi:hypothetical protein
MKKTKNKDRKLKRRKNKERINRMRKQQMVVIPTTLGTIFLLVLIALRFKDLTSPEKVLERLRLHIQKLDGNVFFPTTNPTLAQIQAMATALQATIDEIVAGNKALIPHRNNLVKDSLKMIRELSYDIQYQSKGDEEKIKSSGFDTRKSPSPLPDPGQVLVLVAKPVGPGKIKLRWKKEPYSKFYIIEQLNGGIIPPAGQWDSIGRTRRVSFVVEGLNPGQLYYFRVYGSNGLVDGNPSDPAEQRSL